ncbi:MAG TPA: CRISPR-associated protein Cas4 [Syntrophorhabdus sp.]|nr:CRISPR-associated protein Cas4 [Syntrophorhabdus sp.]
MYKEDELLPISALQHLSFCKRQCALIHIEQVWVENQYTAEGRLLHEKAHDGKTEMREGVRITRSLPLRSLVLGLSGIADVVEFHPEEPGKGIKLPGVKGAWRPLPVEYKRGRQKIGPFDEIQLCAQAICLEEMLGAKIPEGALYYGLPRRRTIVPLSNEIRKLTKDTANELHSLIGKGQTPPPETGSKCERCSMKDLCLPEVNCSKRKLSSYMKNFFREDEG